MELHGSCSSHEELYEMGWVALGRLEEEEEEEKNPVCLL